MPNRYGDTLVDKLLRERAEQFGPELKRLFGQLGLTQYEVARRANLGADTLNRIVRGHRAATEAQALRIACAVAMTAKQRQVASEIVDGACFDPLGLEDHTVEKHQDGQPPVLRGRVSR